MTYYLLYPVSRGDDPRVLRSLLYALTALFRSRTDSAIEILALRHQLAILKAKKASR